MHYGTLYEETHPVKSKRTKFFPEPEFVQGSVVFNGQPYYNLPLKYNVYDDVVLLRIDQRFGGGILQLHQSLISRFTLGRHTFVRLEHPTLEAGFYEELLQKASFTLVKKHRKTLRQQLGEKRVFYEFLDARGTFFLQVDDTYFPVETTAAISSIFPNYAPELIAFDKSLAKELSAGQRLTKVLEFLDMLANPKAGQH